MFSAVSNYQHEEAVSFVLRMFGGNQSVVVKAD
jgi:hexokinase